MGKVIFVNGTARCGSTMVDLIMGNDPGGFSLGEVCSWYRPTRTHHFDIKCGCGVYPCPMWQRLRETSERDLYDELLGQRDLDFVVDSSKRLTWVIDQNLRLHAQGRHEVYNLFLYKAPASLHYSRWKRGIRSLSGTAGAYQYYARAVAAGIPFVSVNYDWLVENMDEGLSAICRWVGIDFFSGKERFWEKTHHHLFGSFGPRRQLFAKSPRIYRESFAEDYCAAVDDLQMQLERNERLQAVLRELAHRDIRNRRIEGFSRASTVRRPWFYYRQRAEEWKRRFFPEPYLDREASTIQEWSI